MSDLISRQAAIDAFQNLAYEDWNQGVSTSWADAFTECAEIISGLPSAQLPIVSNTVVGYVPPLKRTNADRIRSMTDEELAAWYFKSFFMKAPYCKGKLCPDCECEECLAEWLKSEAET